MNKIYCAEALISPRTLQDLDHVHHFASEIAAKQSFDKTWENHCPVKFEPLITREGWKVVGKPGGVPFMLGRITVIEVPDMVQDFPINLELVP